MTSDDNPVAGTEASKTAWARVVLYSSVLTAAMTVVTFSLASIAIPSSGRRADRVEYPYPNTLSEFPRDSV